MKEKNAFGGLFLIWILSKFVSILAKAGKTMSARCVSELLYEVTYSDALAFYNPDEVAIFEELIEWLDIIYELNVDINFKNTLIVVRKEWMTKVE